MLYDEMQPSSQSSVAGLSVPQVRASLAVLRHQWMQHSPVNPFYTSMELPCQMTANDFAFNFIMGHHCKRQQRKHLSS